MVGYPAAPSQAKRGKAYPSLNAVEAKLSAMAEGQAARANEGYAEAVMRLVKQGLGGAEIGRRLGICRQRVHQIRHEHGLPQGLDVRRDAVKKMATEEGLRIVEIAERLGIDYETVKHDRRYSGLSKLTGVAREKRRKAVLRMVDEGFTSLQISKDLNVPFSTVVTDRSKRVKNGIHKQA